MEFPSTEDLPLSEEATQYINDFTWSIEQAKIALDHLMLMLPPGKQVELRRKIIEAMDMFNRRTDHLMHMQ